MRAVVIYRLPSGRHIAAEVMEYLVEGAKRAGRDDDMPVVAVIRVKRSYLERRGLNYD